MQKKQKKICLVVHYLAFGGLGRATANISIALEKMGYEVFIVTVYKDVTFEYAGTLINMGEFKSEKNTSLNRLRRFFVLKKKMSKINIDLYIDLRTRTSFVKEYLINFFIYKKKVVYTIRNADFQKYICFNIDHFKKLHKRSMGLLTISHWLKNEFKEKFDIDNIETIYNPINSSLIEEKINEEIDVSPGFIFAVGQMNNNLKGFDHLIKAYAESHARRENIQLVIAGGGGLLGFYKKLARELEIDKDVVFLGMVENPFKYYAQAGFYILSSKNEGFPNVILEALSCGCPVVSYDCLSGPSEIIIDKENGLLIDNQDVSALSKAINTFIDNKELRDYCKSNAKASVENYSFENIGKQWKNYLNKIIK